MMSLQEIQSVNFDKSFLGGYETKAVDEFIENMTESYAVLQKENIALKSKMKVLVDKIEEYRSVEDGMRKALLSAQNIADDVISKANEMATQIEQTATANAELKLKEHEEKLRAEEIRTESLRKSTRSFFEKVTEFYKNELNVLGSMVESLELSDSEASADSSNNSIEEQTKEINELVSSFLSQTLTSKDMLGSLDEFLPKSDEEEQSASEETFVEIPKVEICNFDIPIDEEKSSETPVN